MNRPCKFPDGIGNECLSLFEGYAQTFPEGDYQWNMDQNALKKFLSGLALPDGIFDAGSGPGLYLQNVLNEHLNPRGLVIGFDFSWRMLRRAVKDGRDEFAEFVLGDLRRLPFQEKSFGLVLCTNNTLGNIPATCPDSSFGLRKQIVRSLTKLLKRGGALFCSVYDFASLDLEQPYSADRWIDGESSYASGGDLFLWRRGDDGSLARVYSHWFEPREIQILFQEAGLKNIRISQEAPHIRVIGVK